MFSVIVFSLTTLALSGLAISYGLAYRLKPSISVLAIFLFILSVWIRGLFLNIKIVLEYLNMSHKIGGEVCRSIFILLASVFFLYTTWKENK
jgi:hypothetical protein